MKVALYTRVSTEDQVKEGTSLIVQRESLESFVSRDEHKREGWEIYHPEPGRIYEDDGYSGFSMDRPALRKLLADAKQRKFDLIIAYKIDRFSRNLRDLLNLVAELETYKVYLKSATEFYDTTNSAGKMMFQQLGSFAEFERNRIKERVFPGMIKGVQRGNWQGSRYVPYGYSYRKEDPEKKLRVVENEAEIVRMMYTLYLSGQSTCQIAGYLYEKGYKTRSGGKFHTKLVRDILRSQLYIGNIVWNKSHYDPKQKTLSGQRYIKNDASKVIVGKGRHDPIVTEEEFKAVQVRLDRNKKGQAQRKGSKEYPLTGILICGGCGHRLLGSNNIASRKYGETKTKRRYYRCSGKANHDVTCHELAIRSDDVEAEIYAILDLIFNNKEFDEKRINQIVQLPSSTHNAEIDQALAKVKDQISENIVKQERLSKIFTEGLLAIEAYKNQIGPLREEEKELKSKQQKLKIALIEKERSEEYQKLLKSVVNHFDNVVENLDIYGKKGLLKLVFKNIVIKNQKIKSFEMFQPFQSIYEGANLKWQTQINQQVAAIPESVSTLRPTDVR